MSYHTEELNENVAAGEEEVIGQLEVPKGHEYVILGVQFVPGTDGLIEGWYDNERVDRITTLGCRDVDGIPYLKNDVLKGGQKYIFIGTNNAIGAQDMAAIVEYEDRKTA